MAPSSLRGGPRRRRAPTSPSGPPNLVQNPTSGGDSASGLPERARLLWPSSQPPDRPHNHVKQLVGPGRGSRPARETSSPLACCCGPTGPFAEGEACLSACLQPQRGAPARGPCSPRR
ncbi:hypothetical protein NDU88_002519 [Pleurodeles waltl]|uniref:Uncharacterized protein n=1 Tax=Pleurodeles waltl TaxID=8319 RepID=A0AAV7TKW7_PLEWA|nr:hypothetical protein NDU88_002519 [Pleurodeles waltl]